MKLPKVSILIPTYNQEKYIYKAISSAIAQNYPNLEIIISDDNSTDNTLYEILKISSYYKHIKVFSSKINKGRVLNYHSCLYNYSSGDYIVNLDGDDYFLDPNFISKAIEYITISSNNVLYVACRENLFQNQSIIQKTHKNFKWLIPYTIKGSDFVSGINYKYQFSHLSSVYRKSIAISINFYSLDIISTDVDSILRLALEGNVIISNDVVGRWVQTGNNVSLNPNLSEVINNFKWIYSVSDAYHKKTSNTINKFWIIHQKYLYSIPIVDILFFSNSLNIYQKVKLFFKFHIYFILVIKLLYYLKNKIYV